MLLQLYLVDLLPVLYCTVLHCITVLYLLLQLYLEDLEAKVMPVERSPPSLSSSLLSWAGTAVNLGPRLLRLELFQIMNIQWAMNG